MNHEYRAAAVDADCHNHALQELRRALASRAIAEAENPAVAVAVLMQAATDILCQTFSPEEAAGLIISSTWDAVAMLAPRGRA